MSLGDRRSSRCLIVAAAGALLPLLLVWAALFLAAAPTPANASPSSDGDGPSEALTEARGAAPVAGTAAPREEGSPPPTGGGECPGPTDHAYPSDAVATRHHLRVVQYHFCSTTSTQDAAKLILQQQGSSSSLASRHFVVTASEQTRGRGTNNRQWWGKSGNAFATVVVPQSDWSATGLPPTLLPLLVGLLVARRLQSLWDILLECRAAPSFTPRVTLKWPNDVLLDGRKIAGILIEAAFSSFAAPPSSSSSATSSYGTGGEAFFLVGIGVNVAWSPAIPNEGPDRGRPSTSLAEHCPGLLGQENDPNPDPSTTIQLAQSLGVDLAEDLVAWLEDAALEVSRHHSAKEIVRSQLLEEWRHWVDWEAPLVLRGDGHEQEDPATARHREVVHPQEILPDGTLRVLTRDGASRTMVSDYFF